jgi:hypothetical protein
LLWVADIVGRPITAILFALIALISLPAAIASGSLLAMVGWLAQTFLQLVLLSVIQFAANQGAADTQTLIQETHDAVLEELAEVRAIVKAVHAEVVDQ